MKCPHCKEELGAGDPYDLMISHRFNCLGKEGRAYQKAIEEETQGQPWNYEG